MRKTPRAVFDYTDGAGGEEISLNRSRQAYRELEFHPHVHLVMPAAALDGTRRQWRTKRRKTKGGYLFNHKALAKVFRAKILAAIEAAARG